MTNAAITVAGLTKRFGSVQALDGVTFEVSHGTIFGLLGPNGAGKTTAIRVLTTILRPDSGHAEILGLDVARQPAEVRRRIGLAGQYAAVDQNLTGRENLGLIGSLAQLRRAAIAPRAAELLERFDLVDAADRPVRTYSGGMRRRLDVAAALLQRPSVLFLDEPTTGLDIESRTALWATIRELVADGATVLLTTQYLEEADQLADRIAVINHGKVIANDTPAALKARMGSTVIEIGMETVAAATSAQQLLSKIGADSPERDGAMVRLAAPEAAKLLMSALRALEDRQLQPVSINVREPSMDDVFLSLTGKHAVATGNANHATAAATRDAS